MKGNTQAAISDKQLSDMLRRRLQFHNIFREVALVPHMTSSLELQLASFRKMDILASRQQSEIQGLLETVPFLKVLPSQSTGKAKMVRFQYKFSPGLLIVTGIYDQPLLRLLTHYEQSARRPKQPQACKEGSPRRTVHNGLFTMIEAYTKENAHNLQGYLRNRKKAFQDRANTQFFKMENRRVRIFSVGEEDLYAFITDIMLEYKAEKFMKSMDADLNCMPRPVMPPGALLYRPFSVMMQMPVIKQLQPNPPYQIQQTSQMEFQFLKKEEDVSSDSTCFTSESVDKMQDVVQEESLKLSTEVFFLSLEGKEE